MDYFIITAKMHGRYEFWDLKDATERITSRGSCTFSELILICFVRLDAGFAGENE